MGTMTCEKCGIECQKRGHGIQKYCVPCSNERNRERSRNWARKQPKKPSTEEEKVRRTENRNAIKNERSVLSANVRTKLIDPHEQNDFAFAFKFSIPFTTSLSKNHIYSLNGKGHVFLRRESSSCMDAIAYQCLAAREKIRHNKIWIDIFVQKPNHKAGDAINYVDSICDGIKKGLGVDDRWFSIRRVDWEIVKINPQIHIGIYQEDVPDSIVCSLCGRILPFDCFNKNKSSKIGIGRECKECKSTFSRR